ncbi:MAG TPA: formate dehydrogenase accessory protein FdhE [Blastocatellia bacterium]|nr:formate dehydrogenase accessory protein FdhE [Blastocatellia bacterium]
MKESWDTHVQRAKALASGRSGARELLTFYGKLLGAQEQVYEYFRSREGWLPSGALAQDLGIVRLMLPTILEVVEESGPPALAEQAHSLRRASEDEIDEMLLEYWAAPTDIQFFAKAFLQPYARWLAEAGAKPAGRNLEGGENRCPFCMGKPQLSLLKTQEPDSEAGGRNLLCSTCLTVWPFRRVVCANCGEERPAKLAYFHTPEYDHVRVEACDACKHYIKGIDLTRFGLAVPLVDEVAAAPLDLWAQERGYTKIELNLVGL